MHINIPCVDVLAQKSSYTKFIKILTHERRIDDDEPVVLSTRWSAILQSMLPPKLKEPWSITILCTLGDFHIKRVSCQLEAKINLMLLSIFKKLDVRDLKQTNSTMQFADKSYKKPCGIVEDLLVRVNLFF